MNTKSVLLATLACVSALNGTPATAGGFSIFANPYKNQPDPYFTRGDEKLTAEKVTYQDTQVSPRCHEYGHEMAPNSTKMFFAYAWNGGLSEGLGAVGSEQGEASVLGAHLVSKALPAVGVGGLILGAAVGGAGGVNTSHSMDYGYRVSCLEMEASGIHAIPPKWGREIKAGKRPEQSYGSSDATPTTGGAPVIRPPSTGG